MSLLTIESPKLNVPPLWIFKLLTNTVLSLVEPVPVEADKVILFPNIIFPVRPLWIVLFEPNTKFLPVFVANKSLLSPIIKLSESWIWLPLPNIVPPLLAVLPFPHKLIGLIPAIVLLEPKIEPKRVIGLIILF